MQEVVFSDDGIKVVRSAQQEVVFVGTAGIQGAKGDTGPQGPQGEQGPPGPRGPAGQDGTSSAYYAAEFTPTTSLTVTHNLGRFPVVTVKDSAGTEIKVEVSYPSLNQVSLSFGAAFGGVVILT